MTGYVPEHASRRHATLVGGGAVLLWGTLAPLTVWTNGIPSFQLLAMSFAVAVVLAVAVGAIRRRRPAAFLRHPPTAWLLGVGGLFGYHFFLFVALRSAPPVQANLINYLWPLLIVLFSALLPGKRIAVRHVAGTLAGLSGTLLLVTRGRTLDIDPNFALGFGAALLSALIWSGYSVASSLLKSVPTEAVGGFCLGTALLALLAHLALETTVAPTALQWMVVFLIGAGPLGSAFFLWDWGLKRGDVRVLGTVSYAAPLISTSLLIALVGAPAGWATVAGGLLIVGAAALAAGDLIRPPPT